MRLSSKLGFALLALLWGSEWLLGSALPAPPPLAGLAARYAIASVLLLPLMLRKQWRPAVGRPMLWSLAVGLGLLCLPQWLIVVSAPHLPGALSVAALGAVPVLLAVAGRLRLSTALCGFAGVLFLTGTPLQVAASEVPWLLCVGLAAAVVAVTLATAQSTSARGRGAALLSLLWTGTAASAVVLAGASRVAGETPHWSAGMLSVCAGEALLMTLCGYGLFFAMWPQLGAGRLSTLAWAQLLVTTAEAALIEQIRPTAEAALGAALIGTALVLALRADAPDDQNGTGLLLQMTQR